MSRDPIKLFRTLHRRLAASDRTVEVQAASTVEVVRRLLLLGKTEALRRMAEIGAAEIGMKYPDQPFGWLSAAEEETERVRRYGK